MSIDADVIALSIEDGPSDKLELSKDRKTLRRIGNPVLPEKLERKRDQKAADKGLPTGKPKAEQEDEVGADGKILLCEKDFDNP